MNNENEHFFLFDGSINKSMQCCCNQCKYTFKTKGIKIPTYEEILNKRRIDFLQKNTGYSKLSDTPYPHNHLLNKNGNCIELLNFTIVKDLSLRICPYVKRLKNTPVIDQTFCTECRSSTKKYFYQGQSSSDRLCHATLLKRYSVKTGYPYPEWQTVNMIF